MHLNSTEQNLLSYLKLSVTERRKNYNSSKGSVLFCKGKNDENVVLKIVSESNSEHRKNDFKYHRAIFEHCESHKINQIVPKPIAEGVYNTVTYYSVYEKFGEVPNKNIIGQSQFQAMLMTAFEIINELKISFGDFHVQNILLSLDKTKLMVTDFELATEVDTFDGAKELNDKGISQLCKEFIDCDG